MQKNGVLFQNYVTDVLHQLSYNLAELNYAAPIFAQYSKAALKLWKVSSHWPTAQLIIQLTWMDYTSDLRVTKKFPDWFLPGLKMYIFWFTQLFENLLQQENFAPSGKLHSRISKNKMIKTILNLTLRFLITVIPSGL